MRSQNWSVSIPYVHKKQSSYALKTSLILNKYITCIVFTQADNYLLGSTLLKYTDSVSF